MKSIESSTDTLVAENGVLFEGGKGFPSTDMINKTDSPVLKRPVDSKSANFSATQNERKMNGVVNGIQSTDEKVSDGKQDIVVNHVQQVVKLSTLEEAVNGSEKEKQINCDAVDDYVRGLSRNGLSNHCEICAKSWKIVGDFIDSNSAALTCSNNVNGTQALISSSSTSSGIGPSNSGSKYSSYNTPIHSRTPSTGIPATPCEDVGGIVSLNGMGKQDRQTIDLPFGSRPTFDVDGLTTFHDEVQSRLSSITTDFRVSSY